MEFNHRSQVHLQTSLLVSKKVCKDNGSQKNLIRVSGAFGITTASPLGQLKWSKTRAQQQPSRNIVTNIWESPLQKQKARKGQEQMSHTGLAAPRTNRAPAALPGEGWWDGQRWAAQCSFWAGIHGSATLPKQQTIPFVPAMLKHLAPQKAEKSGLGRTPRVSSPCGFSCLKAPPRFPSSGADPWMVNGNLMVAGSLHSSAKEPACPQAPANHQPKPAALNCPPFSSPSASPEQTKQTLKDSWEMRVTRN